MNHTTQPGRPMAPPRRSRNGHHPDCPYPKADATTCAVCASMRKGAPDAEPANTVNSTGER